MLGYITGFSEGEANDVLAAVADVLLAEGAMLAGAVQRNESTARGGPMHLQVLGPEAVVCISQALGAGSQGCRLDPDGLERAVGLVQRQMDLGAALLVVNKFGKQEAEGRGFRPLIGQALAEGMPVVIAVADEYIAAFEQFSDGIGTVLEPSAASVLGFCRMAMRRG